MPVKQKTKQSVPLLSISMAATLFVGLLVVGPRSAGPVAVDAPGVGNPAIILEKTGSRGGETSNLDQQLAEQPQPKPATTPQLPPATVNDPGVTTREDFPYPVYPYRVLGEEAPLITAQALPWYSTVIRSNSSYSATGRTVAVIDTGFALNHAAMSQNWLTNPDEQGATSSEGPAPNCASTGQPLNKSCNNVDDDSNGYIDDWRGWDFISEDNHPQAGTVTPSSSRAYHGTFVASLIAATNSGDYNGIAPGSKILPIQALADSGLGDTYSVGMAIRYAADQGVDVINLSLGSSFNDQFLRDQINYAISSGVVVVAGAGNDGCNCMLYPANYPEVVGVGATSQTDTLATFSSYGQNLDMVAPGTSMCAASWYINNQTNGYGCGAQGTSFAAPLVSAAIVIARSHGSPNLDHAVQSVLASTDKLTAMQSNLWTSSYGSGRLNLAEAILAASSQHYSLGSQLAMRLTCPGNISPCTFAITDHTSQPQSIMAKSTEAATGGYLYYLPTADYTSSGVKALQPVGGAINQPRLYITLDP